MALGASLLSTPADRGRAVAIGPSVNTSSRQRAADVKAPTATQGTSARLHPREDDRHRETWIDGVDQIDQLRAVGPKRRGYDEDLLRRGASLAPRVEEAVPFCWMCSRTSGSRAKEHTFALSLIRALGAEGELHRATHMPAIGDRPISQRGPFPIEQMVAGEVCRVCNGGWMSTLEVAALPILVRSDPSASITPGDQGVLARWFLKTAAVLNSSQNYRLMLPAAVRHSAAGDPHPDVKVFLGRRALDGGKIEFTQQAGVAFGFAPTDRQAELRALMAKGYACAIGVNDLLGIVAYAPPGGWAVPSVEAVRIWPSARAKSRLELPLIEYLFEAVWLQGSLPGAR